MSNFSEQSRAGNSPATPETGKRKPVELTTSQGSVYTYLPDGRIQRYKRATGETRDPKDTIVFIPPWDLVKAQAPKLYPRIFAGIENQVQYEQMLLEYFNAVTHSVKVIDQDGRELTSNRETAQAGRVFLAFHDYENAGNNFTLPVSIEPKIGYSTFDTSKYVDDDGQTIRQSHMGNAVTDIKYSS